MTRHVIAASSALFVAASAYAGGHLWKFSEVFSNADGTIQFVELTLPTNSNFETALSGKKIKSAATGKEYTFPANLTPPTGLKSILLATADFAALPGAPTPDHIIPANFFGLNGDTLTYHVYDTWVIQSGQIPVDCVNSFNRNAPLVVANSPKNYAGVQGTVDACPAPACPADLDGDGEVSGGDMGALLGAWGTRDEDADLDGNGIVDAADLSILLGSWGDCA